MDWKRPSYDFISRVVRKISTLNVDEIDTDEMETVCSVSKKIKAI
jgi:hypothetical protein